LWLGIFNIIEIILWLLTIKLHICSNIEPLSRSDSRVLLDAWPWINMISLIRHACYFKIISYLF
jgi:hypothetical protein